MSVRIAVAVLGVSLLIGACGAGSGPNGGSTSSQSSGPRMSRVAISKT